MVIIIKLLLKFDYDFTFFNYVLVNLINVLLKHQRKKSITKNKTIATEIFW